MTTPVVWHPACRLHQAGAGHPERPERVAAVLDALRAPARAVAVALAARHAQHLGRRHVLIVDWDVHHGNGTQAIVERDATVRFVSMHQYPWYPGTGAADERGVGNIFNVPRPPGLPRATYVHDLLAAVGAALDGWRPDVVLVSAGFD